MKKIILHPDQTQQAKKALATAFAVFLISVALTVILRLQVLSLASRSIVGSSGALRTLDLLQTLTTTLVWINRLSALVIAACALYLIVQSFTDREQ